MHDEIPDREELQRQPDMRRQSAVGHSPSSQGKGKLGTFVTVIGEQDPVVASRVQGGGSTPLDTAAADARDAFFRADALALNGGGQPEVQVRL